MAPPCQEADAPTERRGWKGDILRLIDKLDIKGIVPTMRAQIVQAFAVALLIAIPARAQSSDNLDFHFDCELGQKAAHVTTEGGRLVYKYGSPGKVELTIREDPTHSNVFYRRDKLGLKGEGQQLRFENGRYSYVLSSWYVAAAGGEDQVKFFVLEGEKVITSRLCRSAPSFEEYGQFDRLAHDAMRPLGYPLEVR